MNPVQSSLYIRKPRGQPADQIRVRRDPEPNAIDHTSESDIRAGQYIYVRFHPWSDALQLRLSKVRDGPPNVRIDKRKDLLTGVCVGSLGNGKVRHAGVERRQDFAVLQIVLSNVDRSLLAGKLPL